MKYLLIVFLTFVMTGQCENVLVFAGSTRAESINKKLAKEAVRIAQEMGHQVTFIDLKDYPMPFYDGDLEEVSGMPENARKLRELMMANHLIILASPEYNGSISGVLKNALDWVSRGDRSALKEKKFGLMSASPGKAGGARGLVHLQAILQNMGGQVIAKQISIPNAYEKGALRVVQAELKEMLKN